MATCNFLICSLTWWFQHSCHIPTMSMLLFSLLWTRLALSSLLPTGTKAHGRLWSALPDLRWSSGWLLGAYCRCQEACHAYIHTKMKHIFLQKGSKIRNLFPLFGHGYCEQLLRFSKIQLLTYDEFSFNRVSTSGGMLLSESHAAASQ